MINKSLKNLIFERIYIETIIEVRKSEEKANENSIAVLGTYNSMMKEVRKRLAEMNWDMADEEVISKLKKMSKEYKALAEEITENIKDMTDDCEMMFKGNFARTAELISVAIDTFLEKSKTAIESGK